MIRRSCCCWCSCGRLAADRPRSHAPPRRPSRGWRSGLERRIDTLWARARTAVRHGSGATRSSISTGSCSSSRRATRGAQATCSRARRSSHEQPPAAAREFRRSPTTRGMIRWPPEALLRVGDVYADLWRRPELDPSYGQTSLATYRSCSTGIRHHGGQRAQERIDTCRSDRTKEYKAALYYMRLKASTRASCISRTWSRRTRGARCPDALIHLVQAYRTAGHKEDVQETCGDTSAGSTRRRLAWSRRARTAPGVVTSLGRPSEPHALPRPARRLVRSRPSWPLIVARVAAEPSACDELLRVPAREQPSSSVAMLPLRPIGPRCWTWRWPDGGFAVERASSRGKAFLHGRELLGLRAREPASPTLLLGADAAAELAA